MRNLLKIDSICGQNLLDHWRTSMRISMFSKSVSDSRSCWSLNLFFNPTQIPYLYTKVRRIWYFSLSKRLLFGAKNAWADAVWHQTQASFVSTCKKHLPRGLHSRSMCACVCASRCCTRVHAFWYRAPPGALFSGVAPQLWAIYIADTIALGVRWPSLRLRYKTRGSSPSNCAVRTSRANRDPLL